MHANGSMIWDCHVWWRKSQDQLAKPAALPPGEGATTSLAAIIPAPPRPCSNINKQIK